MHIMDTDHLSLYDRDTIEGFELGRRLASFPPEQVAVTVITYEEQMRGWLAYVAQADTMERQVAAYRRLREHIENYRTIPIVDFDAAAAAVFTELQKAKVRIGTMDLKIASIALSRNATLLTRNIKDFGKVPGLVWEDWTR